MLFSFPFPSAGFLQVWRRHFLVWSKTATASLAGTLGEPLLYLTGMGFGLGHFVGEVDGLPYLHYLAAGILASGAMQSATFETIYGAFTRMTRQHTYHAMLATPLQVADVVAGEIAWAATKALLTGMAIALVGIFLQAFSPWAALTTLPAIFLTGFTFAALGLVVTAISPNYEFFQYYFTLVITPMLLFCGVFYPPTTLPTAMQSVIVLLPMHHAIALIRPLATGFSPEWPFLHIGVLLGYAVVGYWAAERLIRRRIVV